MLRPEKTVRSPIHLNLRNKDPRGRSAATMDQPIGCRSLAEHQFREQLRPTTHKSWWSGGNALTLRSQTRINSTFSDKIHCSLVNHNRMRLFINNVQSIHKQLTWESDRLRKSINQRTTSPVSKNLAQNIDSGSKTDRTVCRKFSHFMSKKATNQKHFSLPRQFLTTISWWSTLRSSSHPRCSIWRWSACWWPQSWNSLFLQASIEWSTCFLMKRGSTWAKSNSSSWSKI